MYKYLQKCTEQEIDAVLHTEGRILVVGRSDRQLRSVVANHYCFLVDFMHVDIKDILFVSFDREAVKKIINNICIQLGKNIDEVNFIVLNRHTCLPFKQRFSGSYVMCLGVESVDTEILSQFVTAGGCFPNIFFVDNILYTNKCLGVREQNTINQFMPDVTVALCQKARYELKALYETSKRRELKKIERIKRDEEERHQKRIILSDLIQGIYEHHKEYSRINDTQFWIVRTSSRECLNMLMSSEIFSSEEELTPCNTQNINDIQREFLRSIESKGYDRETKNRVFLAWWNLRHVMRDSDVVLLVDSDSEDVRGIGRILDGVNMYRSVVWVNRETRRIELNYDRNAHNPIRVEDDLSIKMIERVINQILRGY